MVVVSWPRGAINLAQIVAKIEIGLISCHNCSLSRESLTGALHRGLGLLRSRFVGWKMLIADFKARWSHLLRLSLMAIAALCAVLATPSLAAGKKVALIIGNSNYINGGSLPNPVGDARAIAASAQKAGFTVTLVTDQSLASFRQTLLDFRSKADTAEVAMIYYAGHGIELNGENWLVPSDVTLADPRDLRVQAIQLTEALEAVSNAKLRLILLDACRDNPFKSKWTVSNRSYVTGLGQIEATSGTMVIFAADKGSAISDGQEGDNSFFAKSLMKRLVEPGLAMQLLGTKIGEDVRTMSKGTQRPYTVHDLPGLEYYLVPKPEEAAGDPDDMAYFRAQQLGTPAAYLEYLGKFPNGKSAGIARGIYGAISKSAQVQVVPSPVPIPAPITPPSPRGDPPIISGPVPPKPEPLITPPAPRVLPGPAPVFPLPSPQPVPETVPGNIVVGIGSKLGEPGMFPVIPPAPVFALGAYPNCKDDWKSVTDPVGKVNATNSCKNLYNSYKTGVLNKFRVEMNTYLGEVYQIYDTKVKYNFPTMEAQKRKFYDDIIQLKLDGADGGRLMNDYERTTAKFDLDYKEVETSYDVAAGCKGNPTPPGLAKTVC